MDRSNRRRGRPRKDNLDGTVELVLHLDSLLYNRVKFLSIMDGVELEKYCLDFMTEWLSRKFDEREAEIKNYLESVDK